MNVIRVAVRTDRGEAQLHRMEGWAGSTEELREYIKREVPDAKVILIEVQ